MKLLNLALANLCHLEDEKTRNAIYLAESNNINHVKIDFDAIESETITRLIRMGFSISYNGMWIMYRIEW